MVEEAVEESINQLAAVIDGFSLFASESGLPSSETLPVISEAIREGQVVQSDNLEETLHVVQSDLETRQP